MGMFLNHFRFFRALAARPKNVGAVMPSGGQLARAMAAQIRGEGPVLELGPGTGCITKAILAHVAPQHLTAIEYDNDFASALKARFPAITVIEGDAFDLDKTLNGAHETFVAIVSGLPLLNFPMTDRHRLIESVLARLTPGGRFIQFSYGLNAPLVPPDGYTVCRAAFAWANIPPARVWVYQKI
jgi:phosphatidylethanolamine/phosphatidyl-N-methylethanolamine N-methyltransferase